MRIKGKRKLGTPTSYGKGPHSGKLGYDENGSARPSPPNESGEKIPPVVNAPDTGAHPSEDLPKQPPYNAEGC